MGFLAAAGKCQGLRGGLEKVKGWTLHHPYQLIQIMKRLMVFLGFLGFLTWDICVLTFQCTAKGAGRAAVGSPVSEGHLQSSA